MHQSIVTEFLVPEAQFLLASNLRYLSYITPPTLIEPGFFPLSDNAFLRPDPHSVIKFSLAFLIALPFQRVAGKATGPSKIGFFTLLQPTEKFLFNTIIGSDV